MTAEARKLLEVQDLKVYYQTIVGEAKVVDGVSFAVNEKEIFGIAGESGCGKSTLVEGILKLVRPPAYIESGKVIYMGTDLFELDEGKLREIRWKELAYIPQGSMNSLNPFLRVGEQITDAIQEHTETPKAEVAQLIQEALKTFDLSGKVAQMYPHELSGGMKQRVCIAMAMILNPRLVVADEPVTALDVTTQRIVLQSISALRGRFDAAVLFIAHDMAVHAEIVDRLSIMYAGKIVEIGSVYDIFTDPLHPYTRGLVEAIPSLEQKNVKGIPGLHPSPLAWPSGCRFHPRCPQATSLCSIESPLLIEIVQGRYVACNNKTCNKD